MFHKRTLAQTETIEGWLFCLPWIIGFLGFTVGPMLYSLAMSFTDYDMINKAKWVGVDNYKKIFFSDNLVPIGVKVTLLFTAISVPLNLVGGLSLALLLNHKLKGMSMFRTLFYIPAVVPYVASLLMWQLIFNQNFGLLNLFLEKIGFSSVPNWLGDPRYALWSLILISFWGVGRDMLVYLGGLQGIPTEYYEAAEIDGASSWRQLFSITLPLLIPVIMYTSILGIITSLQAYNTAYILTGGGPANSTYFYMLHVFNKAFQDFQMGYSSALSWLLFIVTMFLTMLALVVTRRKSNAS